MIDNAVNKHVSVLLRIPSLDNTYTRKHHNGGRYSYRPTETPCMLELYTILAKCRRSRERPLQTVIVKYIVHLPDYSLVESQKWLSVPSEFSPVPMS